MKSFRGPTGLQEQVGGGIGMTLKLEAQGQELHFISDRYFCKLFGHTVYFPKILEPGEMRIIHRNLGDTDFSFILSLKHKMLGELVYQHADFHDMEEQSA